MQYNNQKPKAETVALNLSGEANLTIPEKSMREIDFLCRTISAVEWAGVLFFKIVSGSIETQDLNMEVVEVYPMDKGTTGATGYKFTPDVAKRHTQLIAEHKKAVKIGMIHSHHNMQSYFSGTDMEELNENSANHNWYLSLVVNNRGDMVARIGYRATTKVTRVISGPIPISPMEREDTTFLWFEVKVHKTPIVESIPAYWMDKFNEINAPKAYNQGKAWQSWEDWQTQHSAPAPKNRHTPKNVGHQMQVFQEEKLTQQEILNLMQSDGCEFKKLSVEELELVRTFAVDACKAAGGFVQNQATVQKTCIQLSKEIIRVLTAMTIDQRDKTLTRLFGLKTLEAYIIAQNWNLNAAYLIDLILCTFQQAGEEIQVNSMKKVAAEVCGFLIDVCVEMEEMQ